MQSLYAEVVRFARRKAARDRWQPRKISGPSVSSAARSASVSRRPLHLAHVSCLRNGSAGEQCLHVCKVLLVGVPAWQLEKSGREDHGPRSYGRVLLTCSEEQEEGTRSLPWDIGRTPPTRPSFVCACRTVRRGVGGVHLVADRVRQRHLGGLARVVGALVRPVAERGAETVRHRFLAMSRITFVSVMLERGGVFCGREHQVCAIHTGQGLEELERWRCHSWGTPLPPRPIGPRANKRARPMRKHLAGP
jgi:hypothetical protein